MWMALEIMTVAKFVKQPSSQTNCAMSQALL